MGGQNDGANNVCYNQLINSPIFYGGVGNGSSNLCFEQGLVLVGGPFTGGAGDGFNNFCFLQTNPNSEIMFLGGNGDGASAFCYNQQALSSHSFFLGGNGDGFARSCYQQSHLASSLIYEGGNGDGADQICYEQDIIIVTASPFTGGDGDGATNQCLVQLDYLILLPVELVNFTAELIDYRWVEILWQTKSELNNDYFVVEKSLNGLDWASIETVQGAGNSSEELFYNAADHTPSFEINYYRLKQVDFDGNEAFSLIRSVSLTKSGSGSKNELLIYPNPANSLVNLQFSDFDSDEIEVAIHSSSGAIVFKEQISLSKGNGLYTVLNHTFLSKGHYFIVVSKGEAHLLTQQLIIQ